MKNRLMVITSPYFCAGVITYCVYTLERKQPFHRCAPIVKYMRSWSIAQIMRYCKKRGWKSELR